MYIIRILAGAFIITFLTYFLTKKVLESTSKQEITPKRTILFSVFAIILYSYFSAGIDKLLFYIPYLFFWFLIDLRRSNNKK